MTDYSWLITLVPFLLFLGFLVRFESKFRRRETLRQQKTESYMRPLAKITERMFEKQYGCPSTDIEKAFPEVRNAK